jgi:hypothetical protein
MDVSSVGINLIKPVTFRDIEEFTVDVKDDMRKHLIHGFVIAGNGLYLPATQTIQSFFS